MSADAPEHGETITFRSPARARFSQRFGCLMAGGCFLAAMALAMVAIIIVAAWPVNWGPAAVWALVALSVVICLVGGWWFARRMQRRFWWSLSLQDDRMELCRGKRSAVIRYDQVVLIEAESALASITLQAFGGVHGRRRAAKTPPTAALPMIIHTADGRRAQIGLLISDIERCFSAVLSRCPYAGAIALDATERVPERPEAIAPALRKMGRMRRTAGRTGMLAGTLAILIGLQSVVDVFIGGQAGLQQIEPLLLYLFGIPAGAAAMLTGRRLLRRGRLLDEAAQRVEEEGALPEGGLSSD